MKQPKVIFLDAVGTLFGIRGTVGEIYSAIAANSGVESSPQLLDLAFYQSFKNAPPLAFSGVDTLAVMDLEYHWWKTLAQETFSQVELLDKFRDFDVFFRELYDHFSTASPWFVYEDVFSSLNHWQKQGIALGIISNFDSRIYEVLDLLGLTHFFSTITISSTTGAAKPDSKIFKVALEKHDCKPDQSWHIGDSLKEDYEGAKSVGLQAFLLQRNPATPHGKQVINTFEDLITL
ncbi:REG-2-like, HAD superfamily (subfamily IA) hydrolase [Rippkaea orientalis PCC 8801]|uniref:REG-2-like, HAD superfamily (Subfamily IA) hydrolase n=1 Tax=Rippkaea orientalis (strain PCC 8801 / RF-1) TaxID=41431 RepID=B7JXL0_RIPO1|nr:HAD-IA family hydrolase [Rippkaea orientalis]ACK64767.1 REG-2-like, HAD superfamily (subfamily IA) hydrolase [Rippkaea orientalis PCC 8801]